MPFAISSGRNLLPVKIYYEVYGKPDGQAIIFHHGFAGSSQDWISLGYVDQLKRDYKIILIDMLGYGQSDKITKPEAYNPDCLAMDTVTVLDELNIQSDVIFFGASMGGQLGFALALHPIYKNKFSAFIIDGATPYGTAELSPQLIKWLDPWIDKEINLLIPEFETAIGKSLPPALRKSFEQNDVKSMLASSIIPWPNYSEKLNQIETPFLLIVGEKDPLLEKVCECNKSISNSLLEIIKNEDHTGAYWNSQEVVSLMKNFFNLLANSHTSGKVFT